MGRIWNHNQQIRFEWKWKTLFIFGFSGLDCGKKWINIRDTFMKQSKKLGTGSATQSKTKRNEMLSFLEGMVFVNKQ